ncbi:MAG: hypothetical protein R3362_04325 [Rhodothermales bacterium]|nr:hypothetical protein [Rhodothermales bacterium]
MRPLVLILLLLAAHAHAQRADPADQQAVAETLAALVEAARAGDVARAAPHVACPADGPPPGIRPCAVPDDEPYAGIMMGHLARTFGPDASFVSDWQVAEEDRGVEVHRVQVKVRNGEPPSLPVFTFVRHDGRFLLADLALSGPSEDPRTRAETRLSLLFGQCDRSNLSPTDVAPFFAHPSTDPLTRRALDPTDADERTEAMERLRQLCDRFDRSEGYRVVEFQTRDAPGGQRYRLRPLFHADSAAAWLTFVGLPTGLALDAVEAADASSEAEAKERMEALLRLAASNPTAEAIADRFACPVGSGNAMAVRPCDPAEPEHRQRVERFATRLGRFLQHVGPTGYGFTGYATSPKREGTWHVLDIGYLADGTLDGERRTAYAAFLEVDGALLLGDLKAWPVEAP